MIYPDVLQIQLPQATVIGVQYSKLSTVSILSYRYISHHSKNSIQCDTSQADGTPRAVATGAEVMTPMTPMTPPMGYRTPPMMPVMPMMTPPVPMMVAPMPRISALALGCRAGIQRGCGFRVQFPTFQKMQLTCLIFHHFPISTSELLIVYLVGGLEQSFFMMIL